MTDKTVLAIDPGSSKCGLVVVRRTSENKLEVLWRAIVPTDQLVGSMHIAFNNAPFTMVILGSGTSSRKIVEQIRDLFPGVGVLVVDEKDTTMQARERYWEHNPRRGWRRLLPATMQVPPEPVDDFAALVLAERVLQD